jgi:hypothetical protein
MLGCDPDPARHHVEVERWDDFMGPVFDSSAASAALKAIDLSTCRRDCGPTGVGYAIVTFLRSGEVHAVEIDDGQFSRSLVGRCIVDRLSTAHAPRWTRGSASVPRFFTIP